VEHVPTAIPTRRRIDLTVSSVHRFLWCQRAYYWRYVRGWSSKGRSKPLEIGTAFHSGMETAVRLGLGSALEDGILDTDGSWWRAVATAVQGSGVAADNAKVGLFMVRQYLLYYGAKDFSHLGVEDVFRIRLKTPVGNAFLGGRIDGIVEINSQPWVLERKTTYAVDAQYMAKLPLDLQISTYMIGAKALGYRPAGVLYDIVCRPRQRRRESEGLDEFLVRASVDFQANTLAYFMRQACHRSTTTLRHVRRYYGQVWERLVQCRDTKCWLQNTGACFVRGRECPYTELCIRGERSRVLTQFEKREPFAELRNIEEND